MSSGDERKKVAIGKRIRAARLARGIGQATLARSIGKEPVRLYKYEKGLAQPNTEVLMKLAIELDVTVDWLFHGGPGGPVPDPALKLKAVTDGQPDDVPFVVAELLASQLVGHVTAEEIAYLARQVSAEGMTDVDDLEISLLGRRAATTRASNDVAA